MNIVLCSHEEAERSLSHGIILCTEEEADFLMHYGAKGMKWGLRRWQNEDGSLTTMGRIHYGIGKSNRNEKKAEKYAEKAKKAQEKYERAAYKSMNAQDKSDKKQTQRSADKAASAFKKQNDAKMKMEEYRNKAEIFNSRVKQQEEERQRKLDSDTKGLDADSANKLREAVNGNLKTGKVADSVFAEMDKKSSMMDEHQFNRNMERFDKLSSHDQRTVGDEALRRVSDFDTNGETKVDSEQAGNLRNWLFDRINGKSGNWNTGDSISENNKAAMTKMSEAGKKVEDRVAQVKKDIDYVDRDRNEYEHPILSLFTSKEYYNKEAKRLKAALNNDLVYKALNEAYKESEKDLCGAVLKDIGLSDTPENRSMIFPYVFLD